MSRVCEFCEKRTVSGRYIERRGLAKSKGGGGQKITGHEKRRFKPNIQRVRALINGEVRRVRICTDCIRGGRIAKPKRKIRVRPATPAAEPVLAGESSSAPAAGTT